MGTFVGTVSGVARNSKIYENTARVAVAYRQKENNQWVDKWANVILFGKQAERFKEYGGNGSVITATGNVSLNVYVKGDGTTTASIELMAMSFDILQKPGTPQANPAQAPRPQPNRAHASQPQQPNRQTTNAPPADNFDDTDVPF
jgi:single-stranded DNA-binding protein